jgi:hypothetical protein
MTQAKSLSVQLGPFGRSDRFAWGSRRRISSAQSLSRRDLSLNKAAGGQMPSLIQRFASLISRGAFKAITLRNLPSDI